MKAVLQRVSSASVKIKDRVVSQIKNGIVVFLGISYEDKQHDVQIMVDKIKHLRIFQNDTERMDLSIKDIQGEILVVSQFTLLADLKKGRRPSFSDAAAPEAAEGIYNKVVMLLKESRLRVSEGKFGEYMQVELVNDGPVTFIFDTKNNSDFRN